MTVAVNSIRAFDIFRPGYAGKLVRVYVGNTSTLAALFLDQALTLPAANPQTLLAMTVNGTDYGKFAAPVYVAGAYSLDVDGSDRTGVILAPITDLANQDAGLATVVSSSGSIPRTLRDRFNDRILVLDQGVIGTAPQTNSDTITAAIGKVAAAGGGEVILPAGTIPITTLALTTGVRLRGAARGGTILQSVIGDKVVTISGPRCGLVSMTLDGVSLQAGSIGVYSLDNDQIFMDDCEIKRFATGLWAQGMQRASFRDFYVTACATNVKLSGDTNASGVVGRGIIQNNRWVGGAIATATTIGLDMEFVDSELLANLFQDIKFDTNTSAIKIFGARFTTFPYCSWTGNTKNFDVSDNPATILTGPPVVNFPRDYVQGLHASGSMNGGSVNLANTSYDVVLESMDIKGVAFNLTLPTAQMLLRDCVEDSAVTITGDGTKLVRTSSFEHGETDGVTIGSAAVVAWRRTLGHGEVCSLTVHAVGQCHSTDDRAAFILHGSAYRPAASLAYKTKTVAYTVGATVTGATSKASALIVANSDGGATGTLKVINVIGTFLANEALTDGSGGAAVVSGSLVGANVAIGAQANASSYTSAATCALAIAGDIGDLEVQITGIAATTYAWTCRIDLTSSN